MSAIAIIRMKGKFSLAPGVRKTLESFGLNRLYTCTVVQDSDSAEGMLRACKDMVSYGAVDEHTLTVLLTARGATKNGKKLSLVKKPEEIAKLAKEVAAGKSLSSLSLQTLFFLAPPRGGFRVRKANVAVGGAMGKNPKIGELIASMA